MKLIWTISHVDEYIYNQDSDEQWSYLGTGDCSKGSKLFTKTLIINTIIQVLNIEIDTLEREQMTMENCIWEGTYNALDLINYYKVRTDF